MNDIRITGCELESVAEDAQPCASPKSCWQRSSDEHTEGNCSMRRTQRYKSWLILIAGCLLCFTCAALALADAKTDLSIHPNGACAGGGISFVITNNNASRGVHATVTQSTAASTTSLDISLQPGEQRTLGCSTQSPAGNFLTTWQVQSAQYQ
jgi:hypothetical protein